jgi:hypothetical protein
MSVEHSIVDDSLQLALLSPLQQNPSLLSLTQYVALDQAFQHYTQLLVANVNHSPTLLPIEIEAYNKTITIKPFIY